MKKPKQAEPAPGGDQSPGPDAPPPSEGNGRAAQSGAAPEPAGPEEFLTLGWPLPADVPEHVLARAELVVKAKGTNGRRRAGRAFTPEETAIPLADLKAEQIAAIAGDAGLIVSVRVPKPAG